MGRLAKNTVAVSILGEIRRMILDGELEVGDKLPNQTEFAAQLGVSRVSLREAMMTLDQAGAIEQRPGMGTILISKASALMSTGIEIPPLSNTEATLQLIETHRLLATGMIALVVDRATEAEMAEIGLVLDQMQAAASQKKTIEYQGYESVFNDLLANACHNRFTLQLFKKTFQALLHFWAESLAAMPGLLTESLSIYEAAYEALKNRDRQALVNALNDHMMLMQKAAESTHDPGVES